MASVTDLFTRHPATVGETYGEHLGMAASFGWRMVLGGLACLIHAVFPFLFASTASNHVRCLHEQMVRKRHRLDRAGTAGTAAPINPRGGAPA